MIGKTIGHYQVIEKIGEGGMGVVYRAEDTRLKRTVALKFLPTEAITEEEQTRFIREAQTASALDHPNICTIHEVNETDDGRTFIAMAYCDGETVKEKISQGPLELEEALDIAIQIGEGLSRAHKEGIVHRDIKPANAILTKDGIVKIVDFGLAKLSGATQLTKTGTSMGTAAYMSPEQVHGSDVDHRADIWSLGVVLYEMVTGQLPFKGDNETAVIYSVLNEDPESLISMQQNIPRSLEEVVGKALVKDPANRYQDVQEMVKEIRNLPVGETGQHDWEKSIVVLPFENLSPDPEQEYFSDGLTEEVTSDLSKIHSLRVISRNSAMMLKGTKKATKTIGRELNVQYVLEGSVRKSGNDLRITAQLIDVSTDAHLWAEKYSGTLDNVFDIQENVSRAIATALKVTLSPEEHKGIGQRPIDDIVSYELYLKAQAKIEEYTEEAGDKALRYLESAKEIVGDNAYIYVGMAYAYWNYVNIGARQEEYHIKAIEYANKALELDSQFSKAHTILGWLYCGHGDPQKGLLHFKKALEANPDESLALRGLGVFCTSAYGDFEVAAQMCERLKKVDPLNHLGIWIEGGMNFYSGDYERALPLWLKWYKREPEVPFTPFYYALALSYLGRFEEAIPVIDQNAKKHPEHLAAKFGLMMKYAWQGEKELVYQEMTPEFQKSCRRDPPWAHHMASFLALLDAKQDALDWLENAVDVGFIIYPFLAEKDPFLENIRGEERFKKLMERVKHEWENFEV